MNFKKAILVFLGLISLVIGVVAIVIPGLPTTPFLLLAAGLFMRSSDRLYRKVMSNRIVGPYIREFRENKGMTKRTKIHAIGTMWVMIAISCIFFVDDWMIRIVIISVGIIGTVVMGFIVPTSRKAQ